MGVHPYCTKRKGQHEIVKRSRDSVFVNVKHKEAQQYRCTARPQ